MDLISGADVAPETRALICGMGIILEVVAVVGGVDIAP